MNMECTCFRSLCLWYMTSDLIGWLSDTKFNDDPSQLTHRTSSWRQSTLYFGGWSAFQPKPGLCNSLTPLATKLTYETSNISCLPVTCRSQRSNPGRPAISRKSFLWNDCLPSFNITCPFFGFLRALSIWAAFDCQRTADSNIVRANVALWWSPKLRQIALHVKIWLVHPPRDSSIANAPVRIIKINRIVGEDPACFIFD